MNVWQVVVTISLICKYCRLPMVGGDNGYFGCPRCGRLWHSGEGIVG